MLAVLVATLLAVMVVAELSDPLLNDYLLSKFMIIPEHKLLFCAIEKNCNAAFGRFFHHYRSLFSKKYANTDNWWESNSPKAHGYSKKMLSALLVDNQWHKAVVVREPLSRFLSGYQSKCTDGHDNDRHHCKQEFGGNFVTFTEAVESIARKNHSMEINNHWELQYRFCGGLGSTYHYYNTVITYNRTTLREDVTAMLINAKFPVDNKSFVYSHMMHAFNSSFPYEQTTIKNYMKHVTRSDDIHTLLRFYNSKTLIDKVVLKYLPDYELLNLTIPEWIRSYT